MNNVQLVGRVGKDPEVFTFENGNKKTSFTVATNDSLVMVTKLQYVKAINIIEQWHKEHNLSEYIRFYERCVSLLGVDKTELRSKWRKRELVYARIIITFAINKKFRLIPDHIFAQIMNRDRSTLLYYLNKYEVLSEYEDFSIIKDRLSLILNE